MPQAAAAQRELSFATAARAVLLRPSGSLGYLLVLREGVRLQLEQLGDAAAATALDRIAEDLCQQAVTRTALRRLEYSRHEAATLATRAQPWPRISSVSIGNGR